MFKKENPTIKSGGGGNNRLIGLDIFRIMSALLVFCFHSLIHLGCSYTRLLNPFVCMGAVSMTGFFMLSGFSLFYNYENKDFADFSNISVFYKKRFISIFPIYWTAALIYTLIYVVMQKISIAESTISAPIEFLGIQSVFNTLFNFSHNGGTWFISCIAICYLLFPLAAIIVKQLRLKYKIILFILLAGILVYSPLVVEEFKLSSIYDNPFFRCLEFTLGVLLASMLKKISSINICAKILFHPLSALTEFIILIVLVSVGVKLNFAAGNFMAYNFICVPMFSLLLITLSGVRSEFLDKSSVIKYMSKVSYVFFLSQLFCFKIANFILKSLKIESNTAIILISFAVCTAITVFLHSVFEVPITKFLKNRLLKPQK